MKRFLWLALGVASLAGCEQTRPPTPEGLQKMAARTATGTRITKLETKMQPEIPLAGGVSIWDFKVFNKADKPDGTRQEWKFFNALPQTRKDLATTQVLMNAWLISKDNAVFLPQKPFYKAYGSFRTDWTIPQSGAYTLWVEYQPVLAKNELSGDDLKGSKVLPIERARWDVRVEGTASAKPLAPVRQRAEKGDLAASAYCLDPASYGALLLNPVFLSAPRLKANQSATLSWQVASSGGQASEQSLVALSPDAKTLVHVVGQSPRVQFSARGRWRAWLCFALNGKPYAAPVDLEVD